MIREVSGNLLSADAEALVNTVNTVGVMGKGIALQFKRAYPQMFKDYQKEAKAGRLSLGHMQVWPTAAVDGPKYIINFPTKGHWRSASRLVDIEAGLADLATVVRDLRIRSVAVPPLGCGHGGLVWSDVRPKIVEALAPLDDVEVLLFAPGVVPAASSMPTGTARPRMTPGRAALVQLLSGYQEQTVDPSLVEVQKLLYFSQAAGEPLRLRFVKGLYGPYADNLRHVLTAVEGHFLSGYGDGSSPVLDAEPIRVIGGAQQQALDVLRDLPDTEARIERVLQLCEGFESMYGMELLASVHWVASASNPQPATNAQAAAQQVGSWTPRKKRLFTFDHVKVAWSALEGQGWIAPART
ncbi:MAG: macro domain-containing protein [Actinomycetes bacterium]